MVKSVELAPRMLASAPGRAMCTSETVCPLDSATPLLTMDTNAETAVSMLIETTTMPPLGMMAYWARLATSVADGMPGAAREALLSWVKLLVVVMTKLDASADTGSTEQSGSPPHTVC
jgi:hypothetical protein